MLVFEILPPMPQTTHVKLHIYYKNTKVNNLFKKNNSHKYDSHTVVYQYSCDKEPCNRAQHYIECKTITLGTRMRQHTSIQSHQRIVHNSKVTPTNIMQNTVILRRTNNKQDLFIAEAILIKEKQSTLMPKSTFLREH